MDWGQSESDNQAVYSAYNSDSEDHTENKRPSQNQLSTKIKKQISIQQNKPRPLPKRQKKYQGVFQKRKQSEINNKKKVSHQQFKQKPERKKLDKNQRIPFLQYKLNEEQITCQICWKIAKNALICSNEKCEKIFCQLCTINLKKKINDKCPFCRANPFSCIPSRHRETINSMKLICELCSQIYIFSEQETHYKKKCSFYDKIQCNFCSKLIPNEEMVYHTKSNHANRMEDIISFMYNNPVPILDPQKVINKNQTYLQKIKRSPILGNTGKFYCGGTMETKCTCCNGYCGPTNGQNCFACMKLDVQRLGLPKGYLVNSMGKICYKKGDDFVCGVRLPYEQSSCRQGNACNACKNMKANIKRYLDLI